MAKTFGQFVIVLGVATILYSIYLVRLATSEGKRERERERKKKHIHDMGRKKRWRKGYRL